jgi:hypothetical protein
MYDAGSRCWMDDELDALPLPLVETETGAPPPVADLRPSFPTSC